MCLICTVKSAEGFFSFFQSLLRSRNLSPGPQRPWGHSWAKLILYNVCLLLHLLTVSVLSYKYASHSNEVFLFLDKVFIVFYNPVSLKNKFPTNLGQLCYFIDERCIWQLIQLDVLCSINSARFILHVESSSRCSQRVRRKLFQIYILLDSSSCALNREKLSKLVVLFDVTIPQEPNNTD